MRPLFALFASARAALGFLLIAGAIGAAPVLAEDPVQAPPPVPEEEALLVTDVVTGIGDEALPGMVAIVHYTGWLYNPAAPNGQGRKFDSSHDRNQPFSFPLGAGHVIRGWEQGVPGMKVGGKRRLVIPPSLAYGSRRVGNGLIPPNSTLVFEIELLAVETVTFQPQPE